MRHNRNKGCVLVKKFDKAETFRVKCEVHGWMGAYIGVFEHPFFAVTGEDGSFTIKGLPAGEYTLEAWHEKYGTQTLKVKVGGSERRRRSSPTLRSRSRSGRERG